MKKRYYRRPHRYRKKRSFFRKRFFWLGILAFGFFVVIFYCLFFPAAFQVEKIIVTGEEKVAKQDIEFLVEQRLENKILFLKTRSIFAVDTGQIKKDILNLFPQIAALEVKRGFFDAINVVVVERQGVAQWCGEEGCFLLDNTGVIFEEVLKIKPGLILVDASQPESVSLGDRVVDEGSLAQIFDIQSKLTDHTNLSIVEAILVSEERLNMETTEGWQIYFNRKGDLDWQITELALILEKQISPEKRDRLEYIDLRFSRVFYK